MNIHALAADLVKRIPEMAKDSPTNNVGVIERLIMAEMGRAARPHIYTDKEEEKSDNSAAAVWERAAAYWHENAVRLQAESERDRRLVHGIKAEADGYIRDNMKCINWLCENGYENETGNAVDFVLEKLNEFRWWADRLAGDGASVTLETLAEYYTFRRATTPSQPNEVTNNPSL